MGNTIEFLGLMMGPDGARPDDHKIKVIQDWAQPRHQHDVRAFLGLANVYHRFIRHLAHVARPMADLTRTNAPFHWGEWQANEFQSSKDQLTSAPLLLLPHEDLPFTDMIAASDAAMGAVLMQDQRQGLQPVEYLSRCLSDRNGYPSGSVNAQFRHYGEFGAMWKHTVQLLSRTQRQFTR